MTPPRQSSQTSFIEQVGPGVRYLKCEVCDAPCGYRSIIQSHYTDSDMSYSDFSRSCKVCKAKVLCYDCYKKKSCCDEIKKEKEKEIKKEKNEPSLGLSFSTVVLIVIVVICGMMIINLIKNRKMSEDPETISKEKLIKKEIRSLKNNFPYQENEIWANIYYVMSGNNPVITLTLLYNDDLATADCLAQQLAYSYAQIQNRTFSEDSIFNYKEVSDYGIILEEYGSKVERTNLLIVKNLHELSGNVARIFHTLCDSFAPRVAPSVYIFTLRYSDEVAHLKSIRRAETILRDAWKDLPEKDLHALLSRVVTNVVEVNKEKKNIC